MSDLVLLSDNQARIDALEQAMLAIPTALVDLPLKHHFAPGAYVREIFMKAGTLLTSKIHKTEHMYVVLTGKVSVFIDGVGVQHIEAPYIGRTLPGTRRILYIHEDCRWITFHPTEETDLTVIETNLIEPRELPDGLTAYQHYATLLSAATPQLDYTGAP